MRIRNFARIIFLIENRNGAVGVDRKRRVQHEIEGSFLKRLKSLEWDSRELVKANFPKLWETEEKYRWHVEKRIEKGHISSEDEYIEKIFETLAKHTSVLVYEAPKWKNEELWHRILYSRKYDWIVVLGESGSILTAYKVGKREFRESLKRLEIVGYKLFEGAESDQIKEICRRILLLVRSK